MKKQIFITRKHLLLQVFALVYLSFTVNINAVAQKTFTHKLITIPAADPFMVYHNGYYYLTYTGGDGIGMVKAKSIADLKNTPEVSVWNDRLETNPDRKSSMWAPELFRLNGPNGWRWYLYYSAGPSSCCDGQRTHVLESSGDDPIGPYSYKARIYDTANDVYAIDGSVLQKADGSLYFLWSGDNTAKTYIASMSNPWTLSSSRVQIATPTYNWEKQQGNTNEGPIAIKRNGKIFVTYTGNACWSPDYALGLLTANESSNLLDPNSWVKTPTAVFSKAPQNGVYGPGHNGFFKSPDGTEDWLIYHATTNPNGNCGGERTLRAQKFTWNSDDTPNFGIPVAIDVAITVPSGDPGASFSIISGNYYRLINKSDADRALQLTGEPYMNFTDVYKMVGSPKSWDNTGQQWKIEDKGNGYYKLTNRSDANRSLQLTGETYLNYTDVYNMVGSPQSWNNDGQLWKIEAKGNGYYKLTNKSDANRSLQLTGETYMNFTNVFYTVGSPQNWNNDGQLWFLENKGASGARIGVEMLSEASKNEALEGVEALSVYPNPADQELHVRFNALVDEPIAIRLVDMLGKVVNTVFEGNISAGQSRQIKVSTAKINAGLYVISVEKNSGKVTTKVLIAH